MSNQLNQPNQPNQPNPTHSCKSCCVLCTIVAIVAIIGALNWGLIGLANINLVEQIFGVASPITRIIYILVGASGLALLASYFMPCPCCGCCKK